MEVEIFIIFIAVVNLVALTLVARTLSLQSNLNYEFLKYLTQMDERIKEIEGYYEPNN